jgi:hypothetical protein
VFKEGGGLHGYDYSSMIYYYLLTLLVSNLVVPRRTNGKLLQIFAKARSTRFSPSQ